jgi:hypothetical protein
MPFGFFVEVPIDGGGHPDSPPPRPDQGLPGGGTPPLENYPDNGLPEGGHAGHPSHPIVIPPAPPPYPDQGLPPDVWPGVPIHPETPEHPIVTPPGAVWPPLPPSVSGKAIVLVIIPGVGVRWVVIDTSLQPTPQ